MSGIGGTAFLISFLNIGRRLSSSNETFLLFGANCSETSPIVGNFVKLLVKDIDYLEGKVS